MRNRRFRFLASEGYDVSAMAASDDRLKTRQRAKEGFGGSPPGCSAGRPQSLLGSLGGGDDDARGSGGEWSSLAGAGTPEVLEAQRWSRHPSWSGPWKGWKLGSQ